MFEKILIPTDFSDYARYIVECMHEIPGARRVVLLHVVNSKAKSNGGWFFGNGKGESLKEVQGEMNEEKVFMNSLGMDVSVLIEKNNSGEISDSILSVAGEEDVSLIVLGARGRGLIEGFFLGSVSESVLRKADRHVMIMPYKRKTKPMGCALEKSCINL
ncbi:MAG: universal stress protein, partial [Methanogenium sp.]|nr:universal stress protein [Methanogenium sp.]